MYFAKSGQGPAGRQGRARKGLLSGSLNLSENQGMNQGMNLNLFRYAAMAMRAANHVMAT